MKTRLAVAPVAALVIGCSAAYSQTEWLKYSGNPVIPASEGYSLDPAVLYDSESGQYRMWYTARVEGSYHVFYATSANGVDWTRFAGNPVLSPGASDGWDGLHTRSSSVVFDGVEYKMYYMGSTTGFDDKIGLATSVDGVNWEKYSGNPVIDYGEAGEWDDVRVYHPKVFFDGSTYYMWYAGFDGTTMRGGLATSEDGINWTKHPDNPVLDIGELGEWDDFGVWPNSGIIFKDSLFYLLYSASSRANKTVGYIGLATSPDGVTWTKYEGNPVLSPGPPGSWDQEGLGSATLLFDAQRYKLWYSGHTNVTTNWHIGYAESRTPGPAPIIISVRDIVKDQGRQVRIRWLRSVFDGVNDSLQVRDYGVWRRVEGESQTVVAAVGMEGNDQIIPEPGFRFRLKQAVWDFVASVPAVGFLGYAYVAPTLYDSTATDGIRWSTFMISAHATTGEVFLSEPDSGYSVDNLPPRPPGNPKASVSAEGIRIEWDRPPEPDVDYFAVYRAQTLQFSASQRNKIGTSMNTTFIDPAPPEESPNVYYRITAIDVAGNESDASEVVGVLVTEVSASGDRIPSRYELHQNFPNPFNPATTIRYSLPERSKVALTVYDVRGRLIATLVNRIQPAGVHEIRWGAEVPTGVYFLKMEAKNLGASGGTFIASRRMLEAK